jgi:aminoglycoside phosphotransferase (APT) family kinase protein
MVKMHAGQADVDEDLVRRLVRAQFPRWTDLPVKQLASGGTVNAVYRLGDALTVRLPLTAGSVQDIAREVRWLPELAPALPVTIPTVVASGEPGEGYPWPWAVHEWIDGETPVEGRLASPELIAHDLAGFVKALRSATVESGPAAYRGVPLAGVDQETRQAFEELSHTDEPFDIDLATAVWDDALAAPLWTGPACWLHSDLMPSNLLVSGGKLTAVLDFATVGIGDPACDLIPAWNLLPSAARQVFRDAVQADEAMWRRGRGWALSMAAIQLPYYRTTNPIISGNARYVISEILAECTNR